jgi:hypothetical protein
LGDAWVWDWDDVLKASVVFAEIYFVDDHAMVTSRLGDRFHVTRCTSIHLSWRYAQLMVAQVGL